MAYAAFSVVFGEQPSASKWNILGTNDASFNNGSGIQPTNPIIAGGSSYLDLEGSANTGVKLHFPFQADTTNSYPTKLLIQHGWGFVGGASATETNETVTFPTAYDSTPFFLAQAIGYKATDPTSISDFLTNTGMIVLGRPTNASTGTIHVIDYQGGNLGTTRYGYQWIAIGVKT